MNIYNVRQLLRTTSFFDLELQVVYYTRVSTEKFEQKSSITNQNDFFDEFIKKQKKWKFVGKYIDEGISGINVGKREAFLKMIDDARAGKFDLILTKEISRFARNTLDSIQYTRELLQAGIAVWFYNDNINTIDEDSELRLTIMSGIAQDESRKLSSRIRFGHARSIKNGVVMGNSMIYGWDKKGGKLTVNPEEARMIRVIFTKYASGLWSTSQIENLLWEKGYRNRKGGRIDRDVIRNIIKNPKYKGYYVGNKVKIIDMYSKKQEFLDESEWIIYKDDGSHVPALIEENIWDKANQIMAERGKLIKDRRTSYKHDNLFTGKIVCMHDGCRYWLKAHTTRGYTDPNWVCSCKLKNGKDSCMSFPLKEKFLRHTLASAFNFVINNRTTIVKDTIAFYQKYNQQLPNNEDQILTLQKEIELLNMKRDRILEFNLAGHISNEEFIKRNNQFTQEITQKQELIDTLTVNPIDEVELEKSLKELVETITDNAKISPKDINQFMIQETIETIKVKTVSNDKAEIYFYFKNKIASVAGVKTMYHRYGYESSEGNEMIFFSTK